MRYDKEFKLKSINLFKHGNSSISEVALSNNVPKQTLARWIKLYKRFGYVGLENKKSGVKEAPIDPGFEKLVIDKWNKNKRSPYKMRKDLRKDLKRNGYDISQRQIKKIYKKHKLTNS